jgi:hypothetical protein
MAKILSEPRSGKRGTAVSLKGPYGQVERKWTKPKNPRTPAQMRVRSSLGKFAARWRMLAEPQRAAWLTAAVETESDPRLGQRGKLTGCQLFIKINCTLAAAGQGPVDLPTERPQFRANPVGALSISGSGKDAVLKLKVSRAPAHYIMVWGTAPCSVGMTRPRRFSLLGALPAPSAGVSDITELVVAKFGVLPANTRIFIRTCQVANGWEDEPTQANAVIPSK